MLVVIEYGRETAPDAEGLRCSPMPIEAQTMCRVCAVKSSDEDSA